MKSLFYSVMSIAAGVFSSAKAHAGKVAAAGLALLAVGGQKAQAAILSAEQITETTGVITEIASIVISIGLSFLAVWGAFAVFKAIRSIIKTS